MTAIPEPIQLFLNEMNAGEATHTPESIREQAEKTAKIFALPKLELPLIEDRICYSDGCKIPTRIYHPNPEMRLPLVLHFHGGGHVCGSLDTHDAICRRIAVSSECVVLSVAYRLAPEFPYPAGIEDCKTVFEQSVNLLEKIDVDASQVFIVGDSAGGNLALTVAHAMKEKGDNRIKGLALIYPGVDFSMQYGSIERKGEGYLLTKKKIQWYFNHYFASGSDRNKASPINFQHLEKLPPIYMAVAEYDPLYDEGVAFTNKVEALGVPVELEEFEGMIHVFAQLEKLVPDQIIRLGAAQK